MSVYSVFCSCWVENPRNPMDEMPMVLKGGGRTRYHMSSRPSDPFESLHDLAVSRLEPR